MQGAERDKVAAIKQIFDTPDVMRHFKRPEYKRRTLNKIRHAYSMSGHDRMDFFYDGIKLPLGDAERAAVKARHSMTHGEAGDSEERTKELVRHKLACYSLANRVFLRVLGYRGHYLDYTSQADLERSLVDPPQGMVPDGAAAP